MIERIAIELVYALPEHQEVVRLSLPAGSRVIEAIEASGVLTRHPEIDLAKNKVGIFGKLASLEALLEEHDRVEIYRPLAADPKEARRRRVATAKAARAQGPPKERNG